jgi:hypothetical protein
LSERSEHLQATIARGRIRAYPIERTVTQESLLFLSQHPRLIQQLNTVRRDSTATHESGEVGDTGLIAEWHIDELLAYEAESIPVVSAEEWISETIDLSRLADDILTPEELDTLAARLYRDAIESDVMVIGGLESIQNSLHTGWTTPDAKQGLNVH